MVETVYKLAYQVTPIWLTGAPVTTSGGMLPLAALTDPDLYRAAVGTLAEDLLNAGAGYAYERDSVSIDLDNAFGFFTIMPQGTLIQQSPAQYPFANQKVASNATIFEPLTVSLLWDVPMKTPGAWSKKFATITNLQARLTFHNNNGGTYAVVTPSGIYTDLILTGLTDASRGTGPMPQNAWKWDFQKPMVRISDLIAAQSVMMAKLTKGLQTDGSWSGTAVGLNLGASLTQMMERSVLTMPSAMGTLLPGFAI
jgi:hypothetical protein